MPASRASLAFDQRCNLTNRRMRSRLCSTDMRRVWGEKSQASTLFCLDPHIFLCHIHRMRLCAYISPNGEQCRGGPRYAHTTCKKHYHLGKNFPVKTAKNRARFEKYYARGPETECWLWTGCFGGNGYGAFAMEEKTYSAHHAAWLLYRGKIEPGLEVDHLCRQKACVNPNHLEPVTHKENMRRWIES